MAASPYPILMNPDKVLGLITARGGSKGLPRKNVLPVGGKPLVAWTVEVALASRSLGHVVLSSDDDEIITAAKSAGCDVPFRRPAHLAGDMSSSIDVVLHALDHLPTFDYVVLLQPTSPLRKSEDIDSAFTLLLETGAPSCVSVTKVEHSPYHMYRLMNGNRLQNILPPAEAGVRRQDLPTIFALNGAIYIAKIEWLRNTRSFLSKETVAYQMPRERSIDIDTYEDFIKFRSIVKRQQKLSQAGPAAGHN
jgi:CMP-N,N'-diacetyllegionaminic acid synthase